MAATPGAATPGFGNAAQDTDAEAEWPLRVLASGGDRQRRLLGALAGRQLAGAAPLPGNAVVLPLLGRDVVFRVQPV